VDTIAPLELMAGLSIQGIRFLILSTSVEIYEAKLILILST